MTRDPRIDPKHGDVVGHIDGGKMIVLRRTLKMVGYQRHPSRPAHWVRLSTFQNACKGREIFHAAT